MGLVNFGINILHSKERSGGDRSQQETVPFDQQTPRPRNGRRHGAGDIGRGKTHGSK